MEKTLENNIGYILFQRYIETSGTHRTNGRGRQIAKLHRVSYKMPLHSYIAGVED